MSSDVGQEKEKYKYGEYEIKFETDYMIIW